MKPGIVYRILSMLLVLMLLPIPCALAEDGAFITVDATELFFDRTTQVEMLSTKEGYFISAQEAGKLAGLPEISQSGEFKNDYTRISVALESIPDRQYNGETYYALKEMLDALEVYHLCDGIQLKLFYNPVRKNIADFLAISDEMLSKDSDIERFNADLLGDNAILGLSAYGFAFLWDTITSLRFSALWGGALQEDISALLATLMQPFDGTDESLIEMADALYEPLEMYCTFILGVQEQVEKFQEIVSLGDYAAGSDPFLFGIEGTWGIRNSVEAIVAINGGNTIKFADMLNIGAQMSSIASSSDVFVTAAERALVYDDQKLSFYEPYELAIRAESARLIDMYYAIQKENAPAQLSWLAESATKKMISNAFESSLGEINFSSLAAVTATKLFFDNTINMSEKATSVLTCKRLVMVQDLFEASYDTIRNGRAVDSTQVLAAKSAAIMYLKCYWNAAEAFTFDESLAGILGGAQDIAKEKIMQLIGYIDNAFTVQESKTINPGALGSESVELFTFSCGLGYYEGYDGPVFMDTEASDTVSFSYDLNCDGVGDTVTLSITDLDHYDPYYIELTVTDGQTNETCSRTIKTYHDPSVRVIDMDTSDNRRELFIDSVLESDDGYLSYYIGVCMDPSADSNIEGLRYADVRTGKLRVCSYFFFFTTITGYHTYQYQPDGTIALVTPVDTWELEQPLKSMREIPVQWLTNGQYVDGTLPAESEITLTISDMESYGMFTEDATGRQGRFFCSANTYEYNGMSYAYDEENLWYIGDYPERELFYGVEYAG